MPQAQLRQPGKDALGRKRELADDKDPQPGGARRCDFLIERGFQPAPSGNARMAFRVAADAISRSRPRAGRRAE